MCTAKVFGNHTWLLCNNRAVDTQKYAFILSGLLRLLAALAGDAVRLLAKLARLALLDR